MLDSSVQEKNKTSFFFFYLYMKMLSHRQSKSTLFLKISKSVACLGEFSPLDISYVFHLEQKQCSMICTMNSGGSLVALKGTSVMHSHIGHIHRSGWRSRTLRQSGVSLILQVVWIWSFDKVHDMIWYDLWLRPNLGLWNLSAAFLEWCNWDLIEKKDIR